MPRPVKKFAIYLVTADHQLIRVRDTGTELVLLGQVELPHCACGRERPGSARTCGDAECIEQLERSTE